MVVLLLAHYSTLSALGEFTLLYTVVNLGVLVIGGEMHMGTLRLASTYTDFSDQCQVGLKNLGFDCCVYAALLFLALLARAAMPPAALHKLQPMTIAGLIILDHAAVQLSRWHVFLGSSNVGNLILGMKSGLWGWALLAVALLSPLRLQADLVKWWMAFDVAAIAIGWRYVLRNLGHSSVLITASHWLHNSLRISSHYYVVGLANSVASNFDRLLVGSVMGLAQLGVYGFWVSVASGIPLFLTAFVGARYFPILLTSSGQGRHDHFRQQCHSFLRHYVVYAVACCALFSIVAPVLPSLVGNYGQRVPWYESQLICLAVVGNALWTVPYQSLYSLGDDRWLLRSQSIYLVAMLVGNWTGARLAEIPGLCAGTLLVGLSCFLALNRRLNRQLALRAQLMPLPAST